MQRLPGRMVLTVLVAMVAALAPAPAWAQMETREGIALQNQILELRRDVQALRDQVARGGGNSFGGGRGPAPILSGGGGDIAASLLTRVDQLQEAMRSLQGRMDELGNAQQRQSADLGKQIADLNFRLDNGGGGGTAQRTPASPPPASSPAGNQGGGGLPPIPSNGGATGGPGGPVRRTPELAMQEGNAALARRDYPSAEAASREVLANPRTPRAADAQFLLAQALNGRKDFSGAAVAYDDSYTRAKTGPHAADSLLGLANSLTALGEKRASCATLDKLRVEFPAPRPDLRDAATAARGRAGCR